MNVGDRFGRLVVVEVGLRKWRKRACRCRCECGSGVERIIPESSLRSGNTRSCGCLHVETSTALCVSRTKHGHANLVSGLTPTYSSWASAVRRCNDPKMPGWKNYGGRGIAMCPRWMGSNGFASFLADMGERPPGTTLDRFPDTNGNYEPGNCRWATRREQAQNTRGNRLTPEIVLAIRGDRFRGIPTADVAREIGVCPQTVRDVRNRKTWANVAA